MSEILTPAAAPLPQPPEYYGMPEDWEPFDTPLPDLAEAIISNPTSAISQEGHYIHAMNEPWEPINPASETAPSREAEADRIFNAIIGKIAVEGQMDGQQTKHFRHVRNGLGRIAHWPGKKGRELQSEFGTNKKARIERRIERGLNTRARGKVHDTEKVLEDIQYIMDFAAESSVLYGMGRHLRKARLLPDVHRRAKKKSVDTIAGQKAQLTTIEKRLKQVEPIWGSDIEAAWDARARGDIETYERLRTEIANKAEKQVAAGVMNPEGTKRIRDVINDDYEGYVERKQREAALRPLFEQLVRYGSQLSMESLLNKSDDEVEVLREKAKAQAEKLRAKQQRFDQGRENEDKSRPKNKPGGKPPVAARVSGTGRPKTADKTPETDAEKDADEVVILYDAPETDDTSVPYESMWKNKDHDIPVRIAGFAGTGKADGRRYYWIEDEEGNKTAVPEDEIERIQTANPPQKPAPARKPTPSPSTSTPRRRGRRAPANEGFSQSDQILEG